MPTNIVNKISLKTTSVVIALDKKKRFSQILKESNMNSLYVYKLVKYLIDEDIIMTWMENEKRFYYLTEKGLKLREYLIGFKNGVESCKTYTHMDSLIRSIK